MIRVQSVVLPLLKAALPGVQVVSVLPDADQRQLPMVHVARVGGSRNRDLPDKHSKPVVRVTAAADSLIGAEELYEESVTALYNAVQAQQQVPGVGYLQSVYETVGSSEIPSGVQDVWTVGGTVQVSLRSS